MKKSKTILIILLVILLLAVLAFVKTQKLAKNPDGNNEETVKPESYAVEGIVKSINGRQIQLDLAYAKILDGQTAPTIIKETRSIIVPDDTEVVKWFTVAGKKDLRPVKYTDIKEKMQISVRTSYDPARGGNITASRIEIVK
ncbi:MAG: hypothetical protein KW793_02045 [Candidatus Doudnabacteria bacterium]|nr:hypothetical protein [Candidatus Doudnabacteria bacterium]